jgi:hypothetical protein
MLLSAITALAVMTSAGSARAGDFHDGATLNCSDCHVVHTAKRLEVGGEPGAALFPAGQVPTGTQLVGRELKGAIEFNGVIVKPSLLKEDINDLCLSCHDNSLKAADVLGPNLGSSTGDVRQAGSLNRMGISGMHATGHTLDSLREAPGSDPAWSAEDENGAGKGLNCVNCHQAHGGLDGPSSYRNLRADAGGNSGIEGLVTYNQGAPGVNDPSRDVFVRQALSYDESAVDFNEPDPTNSGMGRYCSGCHSAFHGTPGVDANIGGQATGSGYTAFLRHPTAGVNIGQVGGEWSSLATYLSRTNRVKVMSEVGVWDPPGQDVTLTCISCHKAHGNRNAFGLIYRSGVGTPTEEGDSGGERLEHLCGQCHGQPSGFAKP